jgi:TonB-dependent starch-binding outer membrane protein SusC
MKKNYKKKGKFPQLIKRKDSIIFKLILLFLFITSSVVYSNNSEKVLLNHLNSNFELQQRAVSGKVTDDNGQALPGVTVVVKGTTQGTVTDSNGEYSIVNIPDEGTLVFSFVGMTTQEIVVGNQTSINVTMVEETIGIEEVVAIGYGTMKRSDLTGSVSSVKTEELEIIPVYNIEQTLKARTSGVQITQNSGTPGGRIEVRIRGGNSMIGSNDPLYVVDGFPISGGIEYLNPADIESIDILKDASATAIYGARGANGVIIITSKAGKKMQKGRIEVNSYYGIQKEIKRYEVLNAQQYAIVANEWLKNQGNEPYFDPNQVEDVTDWQDVVLAPAPVQSHTLTFSGGGEKTAYSLSGNYFDQEGIIFNSAAKRGGIRLNLNHEVNELIDLGLNLRLGRNEIFQNSVDNAGFYDMASMYAAPPTLPVYDENGIPTRIERIYGFASEDMRNPVIFDKPRKNRTLSNSIFLNTVLDFKITKDLTFTTKNGLEYMSNINESFIPIIFDDDKGAASDGYSYRNSFTNENILSYIKEINENQKLNIVGAVTYQSYMYRNASISVSELPNNITENYNLASATVVNPPSNGISEWSLLSGLSRINYTIGDKYLITASFRADGSSRFGATHKWGYFPSGALAWRISKESFMDNLNFVNNLKLRASYGITGNTALSPYQSLARLSSNRTVFGNNTDVIGFSPNSVANPDLKWESTAQFDIGFDLTLFENLNFVFDYYKKATTDLLASVPIPGSTGFTSVLQNVGQINNEGIELSMDARILTGEFRWNLFAQVSHNKNLVVKLAGGNDILGLGTSHPFNASINIAREGEPFGAFYGYIEDGLDENGFIKLVDTNNDGEINIKDRVILGDPNPRFMYGLNNSFSFKNFNLDIFLEGVQGKENFWAIAGTHLGSFQRGHNQFADLFGNYWTEENPDPNAKYPKVSSATAAIVSDRYVKDASYLRVKTITLAYNLPINKLRWFESAQVYFSGTNLLTFTSYPGLDPEVNTFGSDSNNAGARLRMGINSTDYPSAKVFTIGTKLNF